MKRLAQELSLQGQPGAFAGSLMNSSADLVARACQGEQEAFRLIFERYSRPIISFIYDLVGDRELAEDLTQETFVRAHRGLKALREEAKLSTWLFGIAKNVARESLRSTKKRFARYARSVFARPRREGLSNAFVRAPTWATSVSRARCGRLSPCSLRIDEFTARESASSSKGRRRR